MSADNCVEQIEQSGESYVVIFHCRVFINFPTWFKIMGGVLIRVCWSIHVSFHLTLQCGSARQCAYVYMRMCVCVCMSLPMRGFGPGSCTDGYVVVGQIQLRGSPRA